MESIRLHIARILYKLVTFDTFRPIGLYKIIVISENARAMTGAARIIAMV